MPTAYVTHPRYVDHTMAGHPEHAGRVEAIWSLLDETGLAARMARMTPEQVSDEQILAVHTRDHLTLLNRVHHEKLFAQYDSDTYLNPMSPEVARLAAGGAVMAVDQVATGAADNALAVVRPPGHHAIPGRGMGFCLLGNIAIAARHAQRAYQMDRVMIVDYDVHHGNGTQDMFYDDDTVLFLSTHQYPYYPGTGSLGETGSGRGEGYTINIPLPTGHGDDSYDAIYDMIVRPAAARFKPDLMLVSAGFDAHWRDPLAGMRLSLTGYANLTRKLIDMAADLCGGRIVFVLEGGYELGVLAHGVSNVAHALLSDDDIGDPVGKHPGDDRDVSDLIARVRNVHNL
jgi:acetoin utilization deacetylase AcuC-like enzyme